MPLASRATAGSGLSVDAVGEMSPFRPGVASAGSPLVAGDEDVKAPALACRDALGEEDAPPLAAAPGTATPLTSKLQRTPAWMHREQDGLRRSQRRLKWRQRSHVLTSRIWGMLWFHTGRAQTRQWARRGGWIPSLLAGATGRCLMSRFRVSRWYFGSETETEETMTGEDRPKNAVSLKRQTEGRAPCSV
ncbi:hypothetical protein MKX07_001367 [Trichoderma sp. CBMAI-0711]|nr:hypothetical protein MKX07_001367 [Trichoderma sp. CBMAI-0711]